MSNCDVTSPVDDALRRRRRLRLAVAAAILALLVVYCRASKAADPAEPRSAESFAQEPPKPVR